MKKTPAKRQRTPRRGPGVAELEKILKEQQAQDSNTQFPPMSPPPPPPPPPPSHQFLSPSPPLPLTPIPFLPPREFPSRPNLSPFTTLRPRPPPPKSDTQMNIPPQFLPNFQFSPPSLNRQFYNNPMENFTPASASSSSCPPATPPPPNCFNQIEQPSSQKSPDLNHPWTTPEEQEQIVSGKRTRPFLDEAHWDPNLFNIARKKGCSSSSSSSSSSEMNRSAMFLDSNLSGSYQLGEDSSSLLALRSSSTPNQFAPFHFQETMEASMHRDGGSASNYNKITFDTSNGSKMKSKSKGKEVNVIGSQAEPKPEPENEDERDDIDLDLKL
ncbi:hypothetical protein SDJN03_27182, partial [Cucurbita argyrosperma subsp. sororia]